jgi:hypothetical protein
VLLGVNVPTLSTASATSLVATDVPESAYVAIGGDMFHVDFRSVLANRSAVAAGSGTFSISVRKAVVAGAAAGRAFDLGRAPTVEDVRPMQIDSNRARGVRAWREVISWSLTRTPYVSTSTYEVGPDRLSLSIPQSVIDGYPLEEDTVDVEVNGVVSRIRPDRYYRSVTDLLRGVPSEEEDDPLLPVAGQFVDGGSFVNAYIAFGLISARLISPHADEEDCSEPCLTCLISSASSVASFLAVATACAATGASAGLVGPVCAAALLAHMASNLATLSACGYCGHCLGSGGGGGGGGGDDPSGECPAGFHECCENQCCSDEDPPTSCPEE